MDNSPSWDQPLATVPEATHVHIERRDVATVVGQTAAVHAGVPPVSRHRRGPSRPPAGTPNARPPDSPFAVEDPSFTAITARAAADLAAIADRAGRGRQRARAAWPTPPGRDSDALWDDELGWFRPYDLRSRSPVGPVTSTGLVALYAGVAEARTAPHDGSPRRLGPAPCSTAITTTDPEDPSFDPIRYWRGPVWVLVNWLVADGLRRTGLHRGRRSGRGPRGSRPVLSSSRASPSTTTPATAPASAARASRGAPPSPWPG